MKHRNARLCQSLSRPCGRRAWFSSLAELADEVEVALDDLPGWQIATLFFAQ
jgi:hypothetical protein